MLWLPFIVLRFDILAPTTRGGGAPSGGGAGGATVSGSVAVEGAYAASDAAGDGDQSGSSHADVESVLELESELAFSQRVQRATADVLGVRCVAHSWLTKDVFMQVARQPSGAGASSSGVRASRGRPSAKDRS